MRYLNSRIENVISKSIPKSIIKLNSVFLNHGKKLYIVGGYIRDMIMGNNPLDIDLSTDSLPDDTIEFLKGKYKLDLVGKSFGVIIIYIDGDKIEIASFREDLDTKRDTNVRLGVSIEDDVKRRDITISALFYNIEKNKIVDLVGGVEDIQNKIIRMVGDPLRRLEEDPLRLLRCIRFATRYDFKIEEKTKKALINSTLKGVSMERIWDTKNGEFMKSFKQSQDFQQYLDFITEFDLWGQILPGLKVNPKIKNQDTIVLVMAQLLLGNDPKSIRKTLSKSAISGEIIDQVILLQALLNLTIEDVVKFYKTKVRFKLSNETINIWFEINDVSNPDILKFTEYKPTVTAQYVMDEYNLEGEELGKKIRELEIESYRKLGLFKK